MGFDISKEVYDPHIFENSTHDEIKSWLKINCRNAFKLTKKPRHTSSSMVGYMRPKWYIYADIKNKNDAAIFKLFFGEKISTSCRYKIT